MAEGRFVSRSISTNEQLATVSTDAALLFSWMIPHIDVDGRLSGSAISIKANVVPLRDEITIKRIPKLLAELGKAIDADGASLIVWYEVGRQQVVFFPGFAGQQTLRRDREAPSRLPALSTSARILAGNLSGTTPAPTPADTPDLLPESVRETGSQQQVEVQGEVEVQGQGQEEPSSSARLRETSLHRRLVSNLDRQALDLLLASVDNPASWIADFGASLDGMAGHRPATPIQLGIALREYAKNGATKAPNSAQFDVYLRRATQRESESRAATQPPTNGARHRARMNPGEQQVANILGTSRGGES